MRGTKSPRGLRGFMTARRNPEEKQKPGRRPLFGVTMTKRQQLVRRRDLVRTLVAAEKLRRGGCLTCGIAATPDNLMIFDFDHRDRAAKRYRISTFTVLKGLQEEMDKCDMLCANCHRLKTHANRDYLVIDALDEPRVIDALF